MLSVTGPLQEYRLQILIAMTAVALQNVTMETFHIWMLKVSGGQAVTVASGMLIVRSHRLITYQRILTMEYILSKNRKL
jgi:hypothetical protein